MPAEPSYEVIVKECEKGVTRRVRTYEIPLKDEAALRPILSGFKPVSDTDAPPRQPSPPGPRETYAGDSDECCVIDWSLLPGAGAD